VLGIDCYEVHTGKRLNKQAKRKKIDTDSAFQLGLEGKAFALQALADHDVTLVRMSRNKDVYDRLLRYVYIDGENYADLIKPKHLSVETGKIPDSDKPKRKVTEEEKENEDDE
jgi:endonuclease YncB( thermonuclease family)